MSNSSFWLYQKYQIIGNQDPIPVIPLTYSVSGDTLDPQPLVEKLENDPKCGYVPPVEYQYRDIESGYTCVDLDKYTKIVSQRSSDGIHWENVSYSAGTLIQQNSSDCGYIGTIYRLKASGTTCYQGDKYMQMVEQVSNDNIHWTNTGRVERGYLIESGSSDCPELKLKATYSDSSEYEVYCNSSTTLTSGETKPSGYTYSAMTDAVIGNCVAEIGHWYEGGAFEDCISLSSVTIPDSVTSISGNAFRNCNSLTSITIPDSVTYIGSYAFSSCGLINVDIPSSVTIINNNAFAGCSYLTSCTISSNVTEIFDYIFQLCTRLTSITIPDSVTSIGEHAFSFCFNMTSCTIGSGITSIGINAFSFCSSLESITINATTPPTLGTNPFQYTNDCPIYVPAASVSAYQSASGWSTYASRIQAIP